MSRPHWFVEALENRTLLSVGQLDPSFGTGGKVTVDFHGTLVQSTAVATQADGKTVVAGPSNDPGHETDVALTRFNVNGTLDTTFGPNHNGISRPLAVNTVRAMTIQSDGKILVAGEVSFRHTMYVARFTATGSLDTSFDGDGVANIPFDQGCEARALAIQSDHKIIVVGDDREGFFSLTQNFAVVRLNSNGSMDGSFNGGDPQTFDFGDFSAFATAVTLDYSGTPRSNALFGTIVVAGYTGDDSTLIQPDSPPQNEKFAIARIKSNGDMDDRFGNGGEVTMAFPHLKDAEATGVTVQPSGKIVVSGSTGATFAGSGHVFTVARFNSNGHLDTSFGGSAHLGFASAGFGGNDIARSLIVGQSGRLIVGGNADKLMAFACFSSDGVLDQNFGSHGKVTIDFGGAVARGMAYGPGHRFVATGGGQFNTVRLTDTGGRLVHVLATSNSASESGPTPVSFKVAREESLPFATRVFFSITGTATPPTLLSTRFHTNDYSLAGMSSTIGQIGHPTNIFFTDIPANKTSTTVTLTPIDRKMNDGDKTAVFTIANDVAYDIDSPAGVKINIKDVANPADPIADAYVRDGSSANTNFGSTADLEVKNGNAGFTRRSYIKFDLSGVNNPAALKSITLELFGSLSAPTTGGITTSIFSVADTSWTESGITFNNAPAAGSTALSSQTITTGDPYGFDVTSYVKAQLAAGHKVVSFMLKNQSTSNAVVSFNSREATDHAPFLFFA